MEIREHRKAEQLVLKAMAENSVGPQIECLCNNPPFGLIRQVRRSLNWINKRDLKGIAKIILVEEMPDYARSNDDSASTRGFYRYKTKDSPAIIILSIRELYRGIPWFLWWSPVPTLRIGWTLAHEVGHHLIFREEAFMTEISLDKEVRADKYAEIVLQRMTRRWYYRVGQWCINDLADWYFAFGLAAAQKKRYQVAAKRFYTAWHLNPNIENVADYYLSAKRKSISQ